MGAYRCDMCEGYFCSHDNTCHESPVSQYGLICDGCYIENACYCCGKLDKETKYCKLSDIYFCDSCV